MTIAISVRAGFGPTLMLRYVSRQTPSSSHQSRWIHSPPKPPSSPSSSNHNDLPSFLSYALRTSLSRTSTVFVGTSYEYVTQYTLRRLGFELTRVGARGDAGVDLLGQWHLPGIGDSAGDVPSSSLRVIVQCKALRGKAGPNLIRELEGAFVGAPSGWRGDGGGVLGLLVSEKAATKGVREALGRSRWPLGWVMLEKMGGDGLAGETEEEKKEDKEERHGNEPVGKVRQLLWNRVAQQTGLEGFTVSLRHREGKGSLDKEGEGTGGLDSECVLMWKGHVVEADLDKHGKTAEEDDG